MIGEETAEPIRVLICDDYYLIREGLKVVLGRYSDIKIIAEAETAEEALPLVEEFLPDVVIMDVLLPGMDGMEATRRIKQAHPSVAVIVLTRYDDVEHIMQIYSCGASAYLRKGVKAEELVTTIRAVSNGGVVLHPHVATAVIQAFSKVPDAHRNVARASLSAREIEVLRLVAQGLSNKEIARRLNISVRTAQNHLANIFRKLELNDRFAAAVYALRQGLAEPEAIERPVADRFGAPTP
ncbi:MAG TPA: response regulator transcription factor [Chloroflexota bacterium]